MNVVVDASVAFKWLIDENGSAAALALRAENDILVPDLLLVEARNALLTNVRRKKLSIEQARRAEREINAFGVDVVPSGPFLDLAFEIALELGEPIYDCIYLAVAAVTDRTLVTADERFAAKVAASPAGRNRVRLLAAQPQ